MQWSNCRSLKHTESEKTTLKRWSFAGNIVTAGTPKHRNSCMYSESLICDIDEREIKNRYTGNSNTRAYNPTKCFAVLAR